MLRSGHVLGNQTTDVCQEALDGSTRFYIRVKIQQRRLLYFDVFGFTTVRVAEVSHCKREEESLKKRKEL